MLATETIPTISRGLDERRVTYVCAVESTFGVRLPHEVQAAANEATAGSHASLVLRHCTRSSSHSRVYTGSEGWLLAERPVPAASADEASPTLGEPQEKEEEQIKYWFSVLPKETSLQRLVLLAHARWVIEQLYEDAKQECGFDHSQGRSWQGLHRHLALVMLAYSFLMLYRLTLPLPAGEAFPPA